MGKNYWRLWSAHAISKLDDGVSAISTVFATLWNVIAVPTPKHSLRINELGE
ncbi:MAG: hypothetical protein KGQ76_04475 [Acidobacteria bacterium]|nr:hypothetical protein [Acidobacteriota bacterium]